MYKPSLQNCLKSFILAALILQGMTAIASEAEENSTSGGSPHHRSTELLGWLENIRIMPDRMLMKAKLDSGAKTNAIHVSNLEIFDRDGTEMARFDILRDHDDESSERITLEKEVLDQVAIKLRYTQERDLRVVVELQFCIAGSIYNSDFSLTDRSDYNYPVLLGRDFMEGRYLIDPSVSFTHRTRCPRN